MNQVQLLGRLTRDPEIRNTQQGKSVASFTLAIDRFGGQETDFFDCAAWEKQADLIAKSCKKGNRLLVNGRLQQDKWTDQNGQKRTSIKVIVQTLFFIESAQNTNKTAPKQPPLPSFDLPPTEGFSGALDDMPF